MKRPELLPPNTPMRTRVSLDMTSLPEVDLSRYEVCQRGIKREYARRPPDSINEMAGASTIIVVGRYEKILRYAYANKSTGRRGGQHTLYSVAVERYLKGSGPWFLKVLQTGGPLPIDYQGQLKQGIYEEDDPPPRLGERQLLFLRHSGAQLGKRWDPADTSEFSRFFLEYRDELWPVLPLKSRVLFQRGLAISTARLPNDHWRFASGPQLIDMSEAESIRNVLSFL